GLAWGHRGPARSPAAPCGPGLRARARASALARTRRRRRAGERERFSLAASLLGLRLVGLDRRVGRLGAGVTAGLDAIAGLALVGRAALGAGRRQGRRWLGRRRALGATLE